MTTAGGQTPPIPARRRWLGGYGLAIAVPLVTALVVVRSPRWFPAGDFAQAELHVRAVPAHMPLVGAAARVGTILDQGSHPGPAAAIALALPYRVLGSSSWSLMTGSVLLHLAALVLAVFVAHRVAGAAFAGLIALACVVMMRSFGASWFLEPWNPWFGVFPFLVTMLLTWGVSRGDLVLLPWLVLAASFCVQVHLGYGVLVAGLAVLVVVRLVVLSRSPEPPSLRRPLLLSAGVAVIAWALPAVDELTRDPGNATRLWRHFRAPTEATPGVRSSLTAVVNELNLTGVWAAVRGRQPTDSPDLLSWLGFLALVALAATAVTVAFRRRDRLALDGWIVAGTVVALTVVTLLRVPGPIYDYIVRWAAVVTAFIVVLAVWTLGRHAPEGLAAAIRRHGWRTGIVVGAVLLAATAVGAADESVPLQRDSDLTAALASPLDDVLDREDRYLVRVHDPVSLGAPAIGVLLELERDGFDVGVDAWLSANALPHRVMSEEEADQILFVVTGEAAIADALARPGAVELSRADPRSPDEAATSDQLRASIEERLRTIGREDLITRLDEQYGVSQVEVTPGLDEQLLADLAEYRDLRLPGAVIAVPAGAAS